MKQVRTKVPAEPSRLARALEKQPPLRWLELAGILCLVVLADWTLYRGIGPIQDNSAPNLPGRSSSSRAVSENQSPRSPTMRGAAERPNAGMEGGSTLGYAGFAVFFAAALPLMWVAAPRRHHGWPFWITAGMLLVLAGKLVWCGSAVVATIGFCLFVAFSAALAGYCHP
jgi:hypothetical protein